MADVAADLKTWSTTAASNAPTDSTTIGAGLADNFQEVQKVVRQDLAHKGADIASAGTTDLGAVVGLMHDITGTVTITSFGTVSAGIWKIVKFEGALTLTHNATSLILPNAANITTADGDTALVMSEGSGNWRVLGYWGKSAYHSTLTTSGAGSIGGALTVLGGAGGASLTIPATGQLKIDGGGDTYIHESGANVMAFVTGGTERVNLTATSLALAVPVDASNAASGQIIFPAVQNASVGANTLDDYEEGSFTPTLIGSSTAGAQTYVSQVGRYVKIGKMVQVQGYVEISAKDAAIAGNIQLGGLPFTSENTTSLFSAVCFAETFGFTYGASRTWLSGSLAANATVVNIGSQGSGVSTANVTVANTAASSGLVFTGCYRATA